MATRTSHTLHISHIFWAVAAIDAAMLLVVCAMALQDTGGGHDGGREMGQFFFVLLPALVLGLAMLAFHRSGALLPRSIALFVVLVPGLWFAKSQIEDRLIDRRIEADRSGTGYFDTEPMRAMGAAVVGRDVQTLRRIGPTVDVNTPGRDMTLMRLAVRSDDARISDRGEMPVVRALLELGVHADDALDIACIRTDPELLQALLAAGANPNLRVASSGQPLVFDQMSNLTPDGLRLLAKHGLDIDSTSRGEPLPVQLAIYRRWDLLAIAIELGADTGRARSDGRTVATELASQIREETEAGHEVPAALGHAMSLLQATGQKR